MTDIRNTDPFLSIVNDATDYRDCLHTVQLHREGLALDMLKIIVRRKLYWLIRRFDSVPACDVEDVAKELYLYFKEPIAEGV